MIEEAAGEPYPGSCLRELVAEGLEILFIGINPSLASARVGHYYAGPGNLFWRCLHESGLTPERLRPEQDRELLKWGIGITDCVARPSRNASEVRRAEFREAAGPLIRKLERWRPRIACFNGLMGYRGVLDPTAALGLQPGRIGGTHLFVVPSTSAANAGFSREERVLWFARLRDLRDRLRPEGEGGGGGESGQRADDRLKQTLPGRLAG